jgi:APA family basic amino acid/polyamine antiporter
MSIPDRTQLVRGLTLTDTTALVVGTVIGTGVFIKSAIMAQDAGSPLLVLAAWVAAGLLSLAGALSYAELGAMLPQAGGEYVYLRQSYGQLAAFLFGWMRFVVAGSGSIAILGVGFATFLSAIVPMGTAWTETTYNALGRTMHWQFGLTQVVAIAAIVFFASSTASRWWSAAGSRRRSRSSRSPASRSWCSASPCCRPLQTGLIWHRPRLHRAVARRPFGLAMLAALWAYDGWNNMPMAAGEVKDPGRNVPRALIGGMVAVMAIYCAANLAYFYALPWADVLSSNSTAHRDALPVATKAAQTAFGEGGGKLMSIAFVLSALGALNGATLTGARVPFAMARDGLFPAGCRRAQCQDACAGCCRPDAGRMGVRAGGVRHLRSADRLRDLRGVDFLRPGDIRGLRAAKAGPRPAAALQDARLSRGAAGLRAGGHLARGQHAGQSPGRVRRGAGAHRPRPAGVLVFPHVGARGPCLTGDIG